MASRPKLHPAPCRTLRKLRRCMRMSTRVLDSLMQQRLPEPLKPRLRTGRRIQPPTRARGSEARRRLMMATCRQTNATSARSRTPTRLTRLGSQRQSVWGRFLRHLSMSSATRRLVGQRPSPRIRLVRGYLLSHSQSQQSGHGCQVCRRCQCDSTLESGVNNFHDE